MIDLVHRFHDSQNEGLPEYAKEMHCLIHVIVENQLAMKKMILYRGLTQKYTFLENCPFPKCR